jgi:hypothetical protein
MCLSEDAVTITLLVAVGVPGVPPPLELPVKVLQPVKTKVRMKTDTSSVNIPARRFLRDVPKNNNNAPDNTMANVGPFLAVFLEHRNGRGSHDLTNCISSTTECAS